jgi:hypothetical protein
MKLPSGFQGMWLLYKHPTHALPALFPRDTWGYPGTLLHLADICLPGPCEWTFLPTMAHLHTEATPQPPPALHSSYLEGKCSLEAAC